MTRTPDRSFRSAAREALLAEIDAARTPAARRSADGGRPVLRAALGVLIAGSTIAAGWAGVVLVQQHHAPAAPPAATERVPTATPSATPTPTAAVSDDRMRALIDEVRGTGTLTGPITGDFTITHEYGSPVLHLTHLRVGSSDSRTVLVAVDLASATCTAQRVGTVAGTITAKPTQTVVLQDSSPQTFSDLSYMHALALWPPDMGCVASRVSAGTIRWTLPAGIRALASTDLGSRAGASGDVADAAGRPVRYTVAPGDRIAEVAARFGLTENELLYLDPLRDHGNDQVLYAGETLNLDPTDRAYFSATGF